MSGLLGVTKSPKFRIDNIEGKGRGVVLVDPAEEGMYVLEYEADVYPRKERKTHEREYIANGEGCYIIDVQTSKGWVCFDATRNFLSPARLMNHSPKGKATVTPFKPLLIGGRWRLGFIATRDLQPGQELTWDYGCNPGGIDWLKKRPSKGEHKSWVWPARLCLCTCELYARVCMYEKTTLQGPMLGLPKALRPTLHRFRCMLVTWKSLYVVVIADPFSSGDTAIDNKHEMELDEGCVTGAGEGRSDYGCNPGGIDWLKKRPSKGEHKSWVWPARLCLCTCELYARVCMYEQTTLQGPMLGPPKALRPTLHRFRCMLLISSSQRPRMHRRDAKVHACYLEIPVCRCHCRSFLVRRHCHRQQT